MVGQWWDNGGTMVGQWWDNGGTMVGQWSEIDMIFIVMYHHLHHHLVGTMVGQWLDNGGTMVGQWWDMARHDENGFLVSKCDTVVSVGLASNCTSLRVCVATAGETSVESVGVSSADSGQGRDWRRARMMTRRV